MPAIFWQLDLVLTAAIAAGELIEGTPSYMTYAAGGITLGFAIRALMNPRMGVAALANEVRKQAQSKISQTVMQAGVAADSIAGALHIVDRIIAGSILGPGGVAGEITPQALDYIEDQINNDVEQYLNAYLENTVGNLEREFINEMNKQQRLLGEAKGRLNRKKSRAEWKGQIDENRANVARKTGGSKTGATKVSFPKSIKPKKGKTSFSSAAESRKRKKKRKQLEEIQEDITAKFLRRQRFRPGSQDKVNQPFDNPIGNFERKRKF